MPVKLFQDSGLVVIEGCGSLGKTKLPVTWTVGFLSYMFLRNPKESCPSCSLAGCFLSRGRSTDRQQTERVGYIHRKHTIYRPHTASERQAVRTAPISTQSQLECLDRCEGMKIRYLARVLDASVDCFLAGSPMLFSWRRQAAFR